MNKSANIVVVGSKNPVKIEATRRGFKAMFPKTLFTFKGVDAKSGVSNQPMSTEEMLKGARNRVEDIKKRFPETGYWVGIEGGVEEKDNNMEAFAGVVIRSNRGIVGTGRTGTFILPTRVAELVKGGKELGEADDIVFNKQNSKQKNGAVGLLTHNVIDRTDYYAHAVILALIPHKNPGLY